MDIVEEQGGDKTFIENPNKYPQSSFEFELKAQANGYVHSFDTYSIGNGALELGAGRKVISDTIDPTAGIILKKKIGDKITKGETILMGYTNKPAKIDTVSEDLFNAVTIGDEKPATEVLVTHISDSQGTRAFEL